MSRPTRALLISNGADPLLPAFSQHCRQRGLRPIGITRQDELGIYVEVGQPGTAVLRVRGPDGTEPLGPAEPCVIWFRGLPDPAADLDDEDASYADSELYSCLVTYLYETEVPCLGRPTVPSLFPCPLSAEGVAWWCGQNGITVLPKGEPRHHAPIPVQSYLSGLPDGYVAPSRLALHPSFIPTQVVLSSVPEDTLYYVLCGRRRQVLADAEVQPVQTVEAVASVGDRLCLGLGLHTALIEFRVLGSGVVAFVQLHQYLPPGLILADPDWYFSGVLEALGVG